MLVNMMSAVKSEAGLVERLERLKGDEIPRCVPDYEGVADAIRSSSRFPVALTRVKALADANRLLAVSLLKRRAELCACEIQAATGLNHATVSHHMGVLVDAGLVTARKQGKWLYYRLAGNAEVDVP